MTFNTPLIGFTSIAISGLLCFWRKKKAFENPHYPTYWQHISANTLNQIYKYLSSILFIGGIVFIAIGYQYSWGSFVMLPIYGFMIYFFIGL